MPKKFFKLQRGHFVKEYSHFSRLSNKAQKLLFSFIIHEIVVLMILVFTNAFLWREDKTINLVILYNLGLFVALPFGTFLNSILLKRLSIGNLYFLGILLQAIFNALIIFVPDINAYTIFGFGLLIGISAGIYWGVRNFLETAVTNESNRNYFSGLNFNFKTIVRLLIPFVVGWLISFGEIHTLYSTDFAYKFVFLITLVLIISTYKLTVLGEIDIPRLDKIFVRKPTKLWKNYRYAIMSRGFLQGFAYFAVPVLILELLGGEGILGTISSLMSIVSAIVIYQFGKNAKISDRIKILAFGVLFWFVASLILGFSYTSVGLIIFVVLQTLADSFLSISVGVLMMSAVQYGGEEEGIDYAHFIDHEIFMNIGRISITVLFVAVRYIFGKDFVLQYMFILASIFQLIMLPAGKNIIDRVKNL